MIAGLAGFIHAVLHLSQKKKDALRAFVDLRSQVPLVVSSWHPAEHVKILTDHRFRAWNRPHKGNTCLCPAFPF